jgi:hypothetical protein
MADYSSEIWQIQRASTLDGISEIVRQFSAFKQSGHAKVTGQETITTKAGTFDTFKIETVLTRRPINDSTRKSEIAAQAWYSPTIDHWVKRTYQVRPFANQQYN